MLVTTEMSLLASTVHAWAEGRAVIVTGAVAQVQVAGVRVSPCRHLSNVAMREVLGLWCALLVQE